MDDDLHTIRTMLEAQGTKIDKLCLLLTGNSNPERGLVVRVDRVEQRNKRLDRWFWLLAGAVVTSVVCGVAAAVCL